MDPATQGARTRLAQVRDAAHPLAAAESLDPLLARIGDARYVLVGEASHGTAEYYRWRAALTRRLIEEKGFSFVAVEGDWPDCHALHRSVTGAEGAPEDPADVLADFDRWPAWMWANTDVARFARWLRRYNVYLPETRRVGFFGLDVYSLWESLHAVRDHLAAHHPEAVERALAAFRCFEPYGQDPQSYALATEFLPSGCEPEVLALLTQLRRDAARRDVADSGLAGFAARQNAEVLAGAERYYRAMLHGGPESWNIRDHHMADTLDRLVAHYSQLAKAVVWEHNTHVGDARATDMAPAGMTNVGQLVRERHGADNVVLVGFGSYQGSVIAGDRWGDPPRVMPVPPAREDSVEHVLHQELAGDAGLFVFPPTRTTDWSRERRDHRAIGVVYRPRQERWGNYVPTVLSDRYDAFCYFDRTEALTPLREAPAGIGGEEETWPSGV